MALVDQVRMRVPYLLEVPARSGARVIGLDVARGAALLGIVAAHTASPQRGFAPADPVSWLALAQGHASVLFVLLGGVTLGLASAATGDDSATQREPDPVVLRVRVMVQAVLLFLLGGLLVAFNTPVGVILPAYAVMLGLSLAVLNWPVRLLMLAAGCAVAGPVLAVWLPTVLRFYGQVESQPVNVFITGTHPVVVWMAYLLVGLAIGRTGLTALTLPASAATGNVSARLAIAGTGLLAAGYGTAWLLRLLHTSEVPVLTTDRRVPWTSDGTILPPGVTAGAQTPPLPRPYWGSLMSAEPFSNNIFDVAGSIGFALLVLAAALAVGPRVLRALRPVAVVGSMAVTVYAAHIVAIFLIDPRRRTPGVSNPLLDPAQNWMLVALLAVIVSAALLWREHFRRGPIEALLHTASEWAVTSDRTGVPTAGGRKRITGIDIARGAAVIGMFTAHLAARTRTMSWADPVSWLSLVHGRSSILFALLAGLSLGLVARGRAGRDPVTLRLWVLVRAALIFGIGGVLVAFGTQIAIILQAYALMFVLAVPVLSWSRRRLLTLAAVLAVVGPVLVVWLPSVLRFYPRVDSQPVDVALTGMYPAVVWMAYVLVGLAIGRSDLAAARTRVWMAVSGFALMAAGYGSAWLIGFWFHPRLTPPAAPVSPDPVLRALPGDGAVIPPGPGEGAPTPLPRPFWEGLLTAEPHTNTTFEALGSVGFALVFLALCLSLGSFARTLLFPLAAVGSLALTAYVVQVVAIFFIEPRNRIPHVSSFIVDPARNWLLLVFIGASLLIATGWRLLVGRGPFETALKSAGERVTAR